MYMYAVRLQQLATLSVEGYKIAGAVAVADVWRRDLQAWDGRPSAWAGVEDGNRAAEPVCGVCQATP